MDAPRFHPTVELKLDMLFDGLRYTEALARAGEHAFPNYFPYRLAPGEPDPGGKGLVEVPYMAVTADGMHARLKVARNAAWRAEGTREDGWRLCHDDGRSVPVTFEPAWRWMAGRTSDGVPRLQAGLTVHGDMIVVNVAPGCEYFLAKQDGGSMRCTFCTYGAPDARLAHLGQVMGQVDLPDTTYARLEEVLAVALDEMPVGTIYLVGGSLTDPRDEGRRFIELARRVQAVTRHRVPVSCGSGALPDEALGVLHGERLVDAVCFDLEVWSEPLFTRICPGKARFVGYGAWVGALERSVALWGPGRVYTAMVGGVELGPEIGLAAPEAVETALAGVEDLLGRGIVPLYSPYWPPFQKDRPAHLGDLRWYFEALQLGYLDARLRRGTRIWDGFVTRHSAYMQLECDLDWQAAQPGWGPALAGTAP